MLNKLFDKLKTSFYKSLKQITICQIIKNILLCKKNVINDYATEVCKGSLTERIAALEENIRHKEAVIQINEQNIKLIMEQKSKVRCNPMAYATKLKFLN